MTNTTKIIDIPQVKSPRAQALDALRGLAIIGMVFSGSLPHSLPAWMHHAQVGPVSNFVYDSSISGITWVDLVFPFFIFSMGAAVPFAMSRRLEKGWPVWKAMLSLVKRWLLLCCFAIFVGQSSAWGYDLKLSDSKLPWAYSLFSFIAIFLALWRTPEAWPKWSRVAISLAGWGIGLLMFFTIKLDGGVSMSIERNNIILHILANISILIGFAWLLTRKGILSRLVALGVAVAFTLGVGAGGWPSEVNEFLKNIPIGFGHKLGCLLRIDMMSYLSICIPGSIAGDILLQWLRGRGAIPLSSDSPTWSKTRMWCIALLGFVIVGVTCAGTLGRWVGQCMMICMCLSLVIWSLVRDARSATEQTVRKLFQFGVALLFIGFVVEPYGGGIKKDPATLSYFYVSAGLACYVLNSFILILDEMKFRAPFALVTGSGQNPMIAYTCGTLFWLPVLNLLGIGPIISRTVESHGAFVGTVWCATYTLLVMCLATVCSRSKIFWRS